MSEAISVIERLSFPTEAHAAAAVYGELIDACLDDVAPFEQQASTFAQYPAHSGHPGIGVKGDAGYEDQMGTIELAREEGQYVWRLIAHEDQRLGLPHFKFQLDQERDSQQARYKTLELRIMPNEVEPFQLVGTMPGNLQEPPQEVPMKLDQQQMRQFADTCVTRAIQKLRSVNDAKLDENDLSNNASLRMAEIRTRLRAAAQADLAV